MVTEQIKTVLAFVVDRVPAEAEYGVDGSGRTQLHDPLEDVHVVRVHSDVPGDVSRRECNLKCLCRCCVVLPDLSFILQLLQRRDGVIDDLLQRSAHLNAVDLNRFSKHYYYNTQNYV